MQIQNTNQLTSYQSGTNAVDAVPLSERMAQAQSEDTPPLDDTPPPYFDDMYQYMSANAQRMTDDPLQFMADLITKFKNLRNEDGSAAYKTYSDMSALTTLLKSKLDEDGHQTDDFFLQLNGRIFGLGLFMRDMINQIFFPTEDAEEKAKLFG